MDEFILRLEDVTITLSKKKVLENVDFSLKKGEIHSMAGLRDSGKTTIVKIIGGIYPAGTYEGKLFLDGVLTKFHHVRDSEKAGIAIIYQNTPLIPRMNVCENIFLANEIAHSGIIDWKKAFDETTKLLERVGLEILPVTKVNDLSRWQKLLVKVAKSLSKNPRIIIFDEPTLELSEMEGESFLQVLRELNVSGYSIIFNTHRLNEVFDVADRFTVLREGKTVFTEEVKNSNPDMLFMSLIGKTDFNEIPQNFIDNYSITDREREIIIQILQGRNNREICELFYISLNTVKTHIYSIYQKTGVKNRMELAYLLKSISGRFQHQAVLKP